jgi:hypothetical protein
LNTAIEHMRTFDQMADALDNNDAHALNRLGNTVGIQLRRRWLEPGMVTNSGYIEPSESVNTPPEKVQ